MAAAGGRLLGAHVPATGGVANAPANGKAIAATAIQVFTRNQRTWKSAPLGADEPRAFREALAGSGVRAVMAHASYLINLASVVPDFRRKSRQALAEEIRRCHALGIPLAVVHPGAHMGAGEEAGLRAVARSLDDVLARTRGAEVTVLLEATAGQGSCLGHRFEHLAEVLMRVGAPERVAVCLDTCHLFAAGFDLSDPRAYERTLEDFGRLVGFPKLRAIHLNDSMRPLGSRVDRHARAGRGFLGREAFRRLLHDPRLVRVPMVVETPGPLAAWKKEVAWLRRLAEGPAPRSSMTGAAHPIV
ncbi:MAG TPA: deoxyribonuclease IV [Vicinamibacteria bacterium]|jgi:deoxyribonuclease-4